MENDAILTEEPMSPREPPPDDTDLLGASKDDDQEEPKSILNDSFNNINNNNTPKEKKKTRFDSEAPQEFEPEISVMPDNAPAEDWNWFTSIRSKLENSNKEIKDKINASNKRIEESFTQSNKLIEEKFYEGFSTIANAPARARDSIREKNNNRIELKEQHQSEHWKHERKLLTKFECLDYTTIYNKSYRTELYQNFFQVTGDYEWLRWIMSFLIAALIGIIAWIAKVGINGINEAKFKYVDKANEYNLGLGFFIYLVINLALATLGSIIAVYYEPTAAGSGIPEVKAYLNGTKVPRFLRMRTLFAKVTSMIFANAAGLQVGAEGPMIHVGAILGNGVSQMQSKELGFKIPFMRHFRNDRDKRDFITSGAGAGVAAAFGAPLGGTLFSLEEVSSFWSTILTWRTFFTCMIAVLVMKIFSDFQAGFFDSGLMIFDVGADEQNAQYHLLEVIPFLVIGVLGGLLGAGFTAMNLWVGRIRGIKINPNPKFRVAEIFCIALVSSCLQFLLPFLSSCKSMDGITDIENLTRHHCAKGEYNELASILFTSNEHTIKNLFTFDDSITVPLLPVFSFFIFYTIGACYTAGSGISSGMFVPMVVIGASYGRVIGLLLQLIYGDSIHPGIYAVMGAAAFMAGVSRLTVSLTVIIIEITNDLANLLPIMLVVMTAKFVADVIIHPLFDKQIEMKHIPYLEPNPVKEMKILLCKHIMAKHPKCIAEKETIGHILSLLRNTVHNGFPVVSNHRDKYVKGIILRPQLLVLMDRMSRIWVSRTDMVYSHQEYQTKLAWNLPKLQDILSAYDEEDYSREIDLSPYMNITVYSVNQEFAVSEAYTMFRTLGLRHLVVVSERNKLKGMITKKDLLEHSCIEKYKELKRLKKMNLDLPEDLEFDPESTPGTPADPGASIRISEHLRKKLGGGRSTPSSPLANSVVYAVDPPDVERESRPPSPTK